MEISLNDLYIDPRSRAKCLFVKQIGKNICNFVFNVNNLPLAPQSKKIYSNSSIRTTLAVGPRLQSQSLNDGSNLQVAGCRSRVAGHCFTNTESILNILKS